MASIVEYPIALAKLQQLGLICNYFNGGAFGFPKNITTKIIGWTAGDDSSIRPELRPSLRPFPPPFAENLATAAAAAWAADLPGPAWLMPLAHWAFELDLSGNPWLPMLLKNVGVQPFLLAQRPDASPLEFQPGDQAALKSCLQTLLDNLSTSDFMLAFPQHPILCTIHHHRQLWWITSNKPLLERVDSHAV